MGLFSFPREVGETIGVGSSDEAPPAEDLKTSLRQLGLETDRLDVRVDGGRVVVAGTVPTSSMREKLILALGNVTGVSAVEEDIEAETKETDAVFYEVRKGDTLQAIAEAHYGKGRGDEYTEIFEANKPMLRHPDKIYPGQVLRVPPM